MKIKDAFKYALTYEDKVLAHYILHLVEEKKVSLEDDLDKLDFDLADHDQVAQMIESNRLGIEKIRVFSLKMKANEFVFIFAKNKQDAIRYYQNTFRQNPLNCHEYPLDHEFVRGKRIVSFWDMRKEHKSFPAIALFYTKR